MHPDARRARGESESPGVARVFTAVVLAADRSTPDPVAEAAGVACKAFAPVAGIPMVLRVIDALKSSATIGRIILCGPPAPVLEQFPDCKRLIDAGEVAWRPNLDSPSASAAAVLAGIGPGEPVLLTTADHALLRPEMVDYFVSQSRSRTADVTVALARHAIVQERFPGTRRTVLRMRDGHFCSCNLFALQSPRARAVVDLWRSVEQRRKNPRRLIAGLLGIPGMAAYLLGRLSIEGALQRLSSRIGARLSVVEMPFAEAAVDVDTPADLQRVEASLAR